MSNQVIEQISNYLQNHGLMSLATSTKEGNPLTHSVEYVSEGSIVYFATNPATRKMANILNNPNVSYTVDEDYADWTQIQGVQMEGRAVVMDDEAEIQRVMGLYLNKFPQIKNFPPEFAQSLRIIKVEPVKGRFIDSTKGPGHIEEVTF